MWGYFWAWGSSKGEGNNSRKTNLQLCNKTSQGRAKISWHGKCWKISKRTDTCSMEKRGNSKHSAGGNWSPVTLNRSGTRLAPCKNTAWRAQQALVGCQQLPRFLSTGPLWAEPFNEHVFFSVYLHRVRLLSCSKNETLAWKWHICQLMSTADVQRANRTSCCGKSWVTICFNSVFFVSDILRVNSKRISFLLGEKKKDKNIP